MKRLFSVCLHIHLKDTLTTEKCLSSTDLTSENLYSYQEFTHNLGANLKLKFSVRGMILSVAKHAVFNNIGVFEKKVLVIFKNILWCNVLIIQ